MFAAASSLPPDRATTGSAVLNMSRQIGSAVGVAVLIALTGGADVPGGFDQAGRGAECGGVRRSDGTARAAAPDVGRGVSTDEL